LPPELFFFAEAREDEERDPPPDFFALDFLALERVDELDRFFAPPEVERFALELFFAPPLLFALDDERELLDFFLVVAIRIIPPSDCYLSASAAISKIRAQSMCIDLGQLI
jgi:hypothetical protein